MPLDKPNSDRVTYTFKGITYEIIEEPQRANQLLRDFLHCEEKKDWITIKNRITNGTMWGWLKEVKEDEQGFW
jgi:hypothetical protein